MKTDNETPQRNWVTPNFERQSLKDALAGGLVASGDAVGYS